MPAFSGLLHHIRRQVNSLDATETFKPFQFNIDRIPYVVRQLPACFTANNVLFAIVAKCFEDGGLDRWQVHFDVSEDFFVVLRGYTDPQLQEPPGVPQVGRQVTWNFIV